MRAMSPHTDKQKVVVVGAGPVGALAALYAAKRGDDVHVYELRDGKLNHYHMDSRQFKQSAILHWYFKCFVLPTFEFCPG